MNKLEVFFDYACPYCMRAHELLAALPLDFSDIAWCPCEAHPRPERYGIHSDLAIRGMFYARDHGADLMDYHRRMYHAIHADRVNVEDIDALAACVKGLLDVNDFRNAIESGAYLRELSEANSYAYDKNGVWVVPAYRLNGKKLDAAENVGVSKKQLEKFLGI